MAHSGSQAENPSSNQWPVIAETTGVVDERAMERERIFLDGFAATLGGEYDGWETELN